MARRTKILVTAGLVAASLLAFLLSGNGPWPVDRGVGLRYYVSERRDLIRLTKTEGDITCYLRINVPPDASISVVTLDKRILRATKDDEWWSIEDPTTQAPMGRFNWHGGGTIRIKGANLDLQDWELFRATGVVDSKRNMFIRRLWSIASIALLAIAVGGVIVQGIDPTDPPAPFRVTADNCAFASVEWLHATRTDDTQRMREVLAEWLILKGTPPGANYRDLVLLREGKKQLRVFLSSLSKELAALVEKLIP